MVFSDSLFTLITAGLALFPVMQLLLGIVRYQCRPSQLLYQLDETLHTTHELKDELEALVSGAFVDAAGWRTLVQEIHELEVEADKLHDQTHGSRSIGSGLKAFFALPYKLERICHKAKHLKSKISKEMRRVRRNRASLPPASQVARRLSLSRTTEDGARNIFPTGEELAHRIAPDNTDGKASVEHLRTTGTRGPSHRASRTHPGRVTGQDQATIACEWGGECHVPLKDLSSRGVWSHIESHHAVLSASSGCQWRVRSAEAGTQIKFCGKVFSSGQELGGHVVQTHLNPNFGRRGAQGRSGH